MNSRPLVIITTRLPPAVCGIGTYSWLLQQHWPDSVRDARFLVVDGAAASTRDLNLQSIVEFGLNPGRLARELAEIGAADVLLHYAGRAYHRYGCPAWLPPVLVDWKRAFPGGRLVILFHELPGNFPVTSRHYWIDLCNRRVIRKLARHADVVITNTKEHAGKLEQLSGRANVAWFPVPSNIPPDPNKVSSRAHGEFVVFGLPFGRWQTLQMFDGHIRSWINAGRLTKLHLVGPPDEQFDARSDKLITRWAKADVAVRHGILPAAGVSEVLHRVQFGLANASVENWSKSAVFMAFASHGCAIVMQNQSEIAPLRFAIAPDEVATIGDAQLGERTRALMEWYQVNADWKVIAGKIASLLPAKTEEEMRHGR